MCTIIRRYHNNMTPLQFVYEVTAKVYEVDLANYLLAMGADPYDDSGPGDDSDQCDTDMDDISNAP